MMEDARWCPDGVFKQRRVLREFVDALRVVCPEFVPVGLRPVLGDFGEGIDPLTEGTAQKTYRPV